MPLPCFSHCQPHQHLCASGSGGQQKFPASLWSVKGDNNNPGVFRSGDHSSCCHYFFAPGEGAVAVGPLHGRIHYLVGVEQAWRCFWLLEVILWGAGIRYQVILVPHPDLADVDAGSFCRNGNVKVQLGHKVLWLQQNWFEHDQTLSSFCQVKTGLLYMAGACYTELCHTAESGCHKLTMRCASKKHCLSSAVLLCCSYCGTV